MYRCTVLYLSVLYMLPVCTHLYYMYIYGVCSVHVSLSCLDEVIR